MGMAAATMLDIEKIRADFPILHRQARGKRLIYFDNAATSQKPAEVIRRIVDYYEQDNANVHRAAHYLSERSTIAYEEAREAIAGFIGSPSPNQVVFTRGATEALNLAALSWGEANLQEGDEILVSIMEHHSNLVPWQMLANRKGLKVKYIPCNQQGELDMDAMESMATARTRLIAVCHISNALGTVNPIERIVRWAETKGIVSVVDGCQAAPHSQLNMAELNPDFYAFSGHKMYGPTGIGILYAKAERLEEMPPLMGGGEMVDIVTTTGTTYKAPPHRFEAGTPHIAGVIGLHSAVKYLQQIGQQAIMDWEAVLRHKLTEVLASIPGVRLVGTAAEKTSIQSFMVDGVHSLDLGAFLDLQGVAVRTGNHCAQPLMEQFGVSSTCRASLAFYNTTEEIEAFAEILQATIKKLK